jgi:hypothetical protein
MTDSFIPSRRNFLTATAATGAAAVATTARAASFHDHPDAAPMIRCVRLWTGDDGDSHFEEGTINLSNGARGDLLSEVVAATSLSFQETTSGRLSRTGTGWSFGPRRSRREPPVPPQNPRQVDIDPLPPPSVSFGSKRAGRDSSAREPSGAF